MLSLELLLANLPTIITGWTCLSLTWGVYIAICFNKMIKRGIPMPDHCSSCQYYALWSANAVLLAFLGLNHIIQCSFGDAVLVINVFYNSYLVCATSCVLAWFKASRESIDN